MQEVLHADWQEAWHLPQPPVAAVFLRLAALRGFMCFMFSLPSYKGNDLHMCRMHIIGWGTVIRTQECRSQSPMPYRLAIPQYV